MTCVTRKKKEKCKSDIHKRFCPDVTFKHDDVFFSHVPLLDFLIFLAVIGSNGNQTRNGVFES